MSPLLTCVYPEPDVVERYTLYPDTVAESVHAMVTWCAIVAVAPVPLKPTETVGFEALLVTVSVLV
jgi:hypothetical protein